MCLHWQTWAYQCIWVYENNYMIMCMNIPNQQYIHIWLYVYIIIIYIYMYIRMGMCAWVNAIIWHLQANSIEPYFGRAVQLAHAWQWTCVYTACVRMHLPQLVCWIHYDRVRSQFHLAQRALRNHLLYLALILAHSHIQEQMENERSFGQQQGFYNTWACTPTE
jgi:hypothetical protein